MGTPTESKPSIISTELANSSSDTATNNTAADTSTDTTPLTPPTARKEPHVLNLHGDTFIDNYFWMRNREDPELMPHLEEENRYAENWMKDTRALQVTLYNEMRSHIKESDKTVPYREGHHIYFERTEEGKQYKKICRSKVSDLSVEQSVLDIDVMAEGHEFYELNEVHISPSGNFVAFTVDFSGFRQYTLFVKNLRTGKMTDIIAERVTSVCWAKDNKTLLYTTEDLTTKRSNQVYRHKLGQKRHHLVLEEKDELYALTLESTRSGKFIFLGADSTETSETRYIHADKPSDDFKVILPREKGTRYSVDDDGKRFVFLTNKDAKNFRVVRAPYSRPGAKHWQELLAHRTDVLLEGIDMFAEHLVVYERVNGLTKIRVQDHQGENARYVTFDEPVFEVESAELGNQEFKSTSLRLDYESLVTPLTTLECDLSTGKFVQLKVKEVPNYDPTLYKTERIFATASDGAKVPMSIVYKGDLALDGKRKIHLYGYGAYGYGLPTSFKSTLLTELDRGVVFVIAHIRGGNELGELWREQGYMRQKMNTFTDFIACAQHLLDENYTSTEKMLIEGRSAGGLLMGAVLNLRPDLFKAAIVGVPFVDVLNTMLDETLPLTTGEFEEWGNPKIPGDYAVMKSYSPYDNLAAKDYPAILVKSAFHDSQVMYWEPAKYVAKLRDLKTDQNPLLFKILLGVGGHGGMSGRFDYLLELAFDQAFLLKQLGE